MPRKQYPLYLRLGGSCFGAVALFVIGIAAIALAIYIADVMGARVRP